MNRLVRLVGWLNDGSVVVSFSRPHSQRSAGVGWTSTLAPHWMLRRSGDFHATNQDGSPVGHAGKQGVRRGNARWDRAKSAHPCDEIARNWVIEAADRAVLSEKPSSLRQKTTNSLKTSVHSSVVPGILAPPRISPRMAARSRRSTADESSPACQWSNSLSVEAALHGAPSLSPQRRPRRARSDPAFKVVSCGPGHRQNRATRVGLSQRSKNNVRIYRRYGRCVCLQGARWLRRGLSLRRGVRVRR
jgi:hypothetical protein